jgi:hypothetical protein
MSKMFFFEVLVQLSIEVEFTWYRVWGHLADAQDILHLPFWIMEPQQGSITDVMTACTHGHIQ